MSNGHELWGLSISAMDQKNGPGICNGMARFSNPTTQTLPRWPKLSLQSETYANNHSTQTESSGHDVLHQGTFSTNTKAWRKKPAHNNTTASPESEKRITVAAPHCRCPVKNTFFRCFTGFLNHLFGLRNKRIVSTRKIKNTKLIHFNVGKSRLSHAARGQERVNNKV